MTSQTVSNWKKLPAFRAALNSRLRQIQQETSDRIHASSIKAITVFEELLESDNEKTRLLAAKSIMQFSGHDNPVRRKLNRALIGPTVPEGVIREKLAEASYDASGSFSSVPNLGEFVSDQFFKGYE